MLGTSSLFATGTRGGADEEDDDDDYTLSDDFDLSEES